MRKLYSMLFLFMFSIVGIDAGLTSEFTIGAEKRYNTQAMQEVEAILLSKSATQKQVGIAILKALDLATRPRLFNNDELVSYLMPQFLFVIEQ